MTSAIAGQPAPPTREKRGWGASLLALATAVVVTIGGWVVAAAVPGDAASVATDTAPGTVDVGPTLTVAVEPGWRVVHQDPSGGGVVLSNGTGVLEVYPARAAYRDPDPLVRDYVAEVLRPAASQLSLAPAEPFAAAAGVAALRVPYQGTFPVASYPLEGAVTGVVAQGGSAAVFDASAPQGQLVTVIDQVDAMILGSEIR